MMATAFMGYTTVAQDGNIFGKDDNEGGAAKS